MSALEPRSSGDPDPAPAPGVGGEPDELFAEMAAPAPPRPAARPVALTPEGEPARRRVAPIVTTTTAAAASAGHGSVTTADRSPVPVVAEASGPDGAGEYGGEDEDDDDFDEIPTGWRGRPKGKLKARRVRRVIRYVSPWSVFKVAVLFSICLWLILMVAGVILWQGAVASGMITNVESFVAKLLAEESFTIDGRELFRATAIAGVMLVFAGSAFSVLMALLFNVISDLTGGIRFTVLELEDTRREVKVPAGSRAAAPEPISPTVPRAVEEPAPSPVQSVPVAAAVPVTERGRPVPGQASVTG